ncbi:DUF5053 domain-containing protein [Phocaeicola salanitronis]|jgi:hypothetical protein|uniref:DUF5053 domain-containing protein n=1 Tax=Phocaeicola salanitronis TaxID=376805 RepID=UPI0032083610
MRTIKDILKEMKPLMGTDNPAEREKLDALTAELNNRELTEEEKNFAQAWWNSEMDEIKQDITILRQQINEDTYQLIPMSYIAKHYFGKSASWLYQRINGNKVGGRQYTLNEEQKATFNRALQDIAKRISSFSIA